MRLRFLGKATTGGQSPTLYATDRGSYVVQGWTVNSDLGDGFDLADGEAVVEIPARLMENLTNDGMTGGPVAENSPLVRVNEDGNYILRGTGVVDADTLSQMDIPTHESCVEIPDAQIRKLVESI